MSQVITEDGEIVTGTDIAEVDTGMVSKLARVELDSLIATARTYPRSIAKAQQRMLDMAILDEETAAECTYALPRDGKTIEGPSIRFAELVFQCWGNARIAAFTTEVDRSEKFVEAQGMFLDCETNAATLMRTRRRISGRNGRVYNDDMILTTSNAAQSIARRNVILAGIPKNIWGKAHAAARKVVMGDLKTLGTRRADAVAAFTRFGLSAEQVFLIMGVDGIMDITQEHLVPLKGIWSQLKNEEITVEEVLARAGTGTGQPQIGGVQRVTSNPLNDPGQEREQAKPAETKKDPEKTKPPIEEKRPATEITASEEEEGLSAAEEKEGVASQAEVEAIERAAAEKAAVDRQKLAAIEKDRLARAAEVAAAESYTPPVEEAKAAEPAKKERKVKAAEKPAEEAPADTETAVTADDPARLKEIDDAYQRGAKAFRRGQARKLDPVEWRTPAYKHLTEAWLKGWQDACTEAENS